MIGLFLTLVILGVIVWALTAFIPMPPNFARLIQVLAIIFALLIVANYFGYGPSVGLHAK